MFNLIINLFKIDSCGCDEYEKHKKGFYVKHHTNRRTTSTKYSEAVPPEVDGPENSVLDVH